MKKLTLFGLAALGLAVLAVPVQARGHHAGYCCETYCCAIVWEDREVTAYKAEWHERDVTINVCRSVPHDVVQKHQCTVMVPEWTPQKRTITYTTYKPREVVRDVYRCVAVPVCCVDPCTGCTTCCYQTQTVVDKVTCTVYDCVPAQRDITVQVCSYKPMVKEWETHHTVCEVVTEPKVVKERYCVTVPYKTIVKVPVCVPCVAACAPPCCP